MKGETEQGTEKPGGIFRGGQGPPRAVAPSGGGGGFVFYRYQNPPT